MVPRRFLGTTMAFISPIEGSYCAFARESTTKSAFSRSTSEESGACCIATSISLAFRRLEWTSKLNLSGPLPRMKRRKPPTLPVRSISEVPQSTLKDAICASSSSRARSNEFRVVRRGSEGDTRVAFSSDTSPPGCQRLRSATKEESSDTFRSLWARSSTGLPARNFAKRESRGTPG